MQSAGEQVEGDFRTNRLLLVLITLFSVAAASLAGWFIVRSITRPLNDAVIFAGGHCRWRSHRQHYLAR